MTACFRAGCRLHVSARPLCHRGRVPRTSKQRLADAPRASSSTLSASHIADLALVNVDYVSPSLWLGVLVCISGLTLYTFKLSNARGMNDTETVTASLFVMSGGILTLQGWRLDPVLMLSEFVLASIGLYYVIQTVELRKQIQEDYGQFEDPRQQMPPPPSARQPGSLPDQSEYYSPYQGYWQDEQELSSDGRGEQRGPGGSYLEFEQEGAPAQASGRQRTWQEPGLDQRAAGLQPRGDRRQLPPAQWRGAETDSESARSQQWREAGARNWLQEDAAQAPPGKNSVAARSRRPFDTQQLAAAPGGRSPRNASVSEDPGMQGSTGRGYGVETGMPDSVVPDEMWRQRPAAQEARQGSARKESGPGDWGRSGPEGDESWG